MRDVFVVAVGDGASQEPGSGPAGRRVFLSYRREETRHIAGRIADRIGPDRVFMDVDNIQPGVDFGLAIASAVESCEVLIAVIGQEWVTAADHRGRRRLDDPDDFVVLEIGTALRRSIRVIPVLVDGAYMPRRDDLPPALESLARRNAVRIDHESFSTDVQRLLDLSDSPMAPPEDPTRTSDRGYRTDKTMPTDLTAETTSTVVQTTLIAARREDIYPLIADFRAWPQWMGGIERDSGLKRMFKGAQSGRVGAVYEFSGRWWYAGTGRVEIIYADEPRRVSMEFRLRRPYKLSSEWRFVLESEGVETLVTWRMIFASAGLIKVLDRFGDLDKGFGSDMKKALSRLGEVAGLA